jgi:transposase-like protein
MPEAISKKAYQRYTQELEVSTSLLYEWRHKAQGTQSGSAGLRAASEQSEADALHALRRQVARLQSENGIF